jgi:hypothetical protein
MDEKEIFDAFKAAQDRGILPTDLSSEELRDLSASMRSRSVFVARGTSAVFASKLKEIIEQLSGGGIGEADARVMILEVLKALGYTPEGGFPTDLGRVPPAIAGSLQDLTSPRRLDLIVRTQIDLMTGAGQQMSGIRPVRLKLFPCWELIRVVPARVPRDWKARWERVGGKLYDGRMIAPKGDPIWGELGSAFEDSLDVDHPPFAFNSGMSWSEISVRTCKALNVLASDGRTFQEFIESEDRPRVLAGQLPLPAPKISVGKMDREVLAQFEKEVGVSADEDGQFEYPDTMSLDEMMAAELKAAAEAYEKRRK